MNDVSILDGREDSYLRYNEDKYRKNSDECDHNLHREDMCVDGFGELKVTMYVESLRSMFLDNADSVQQYF